MARYQLASRFKKVVRTAGSLTLNNSGSWVALPGITTTLDIVLPAVVGDEIEVFLRGTWGNESVESYLDVAFMNAALSAATSFIGGDGTAASNGIPSSYAFAAAQYSPLNAAWQRDVTAGDISNGLITLRPYYRTNTASNKTIFATAGIPFQFVAKNLGKQKAH